MRRGMVDHRQHGEDMVVEEIDFRALAGVDRILERQRMQAEHAPDAGDQLDVGKPGAVEPDDGPPAAVLADLVEAGIDDGFAAFRGDQRQMES